MAHIKEQDLPQSVYTDPAKLMADSWQNKDEMYAIAFAFELEPSWIDGMKYCGGKVSISLLKPQSPFSYTNEAHHSFRFSILKTGFPQASRRNTRSTSTQPQALSSLQTRKHLNIHS